MPSLAHIGNRVVGARSGDKVSEGRPQGSLFAKVYLKAHPETILIPWHSVGGHCKRLFLLVPGAGVEPARI